MFQVVIVVQLQVKVDIGSYPVASDGSNCTIQAKKLRKELAPICRAVIL